MTIRVVVADDFPLIRRAIAEALLARPGIDVVGEAGDGLEAVRLAHEKRPDVLLLDLGMPGLSGLETLSRLRDELPDLRVLIVTASEKPENLLQAFNAGAAGYLTKRSSVEELFDAIANVHAGATAVSPSLTIHLVDAMTRLRRAEEAALSARELDVLRLTADGLTDAEIAERLSIASRTVQSYLAALRRKSGARRRIDLARWARENDLL